jgi:photosystem II stability/assembly factor-like uncharacterized protein
VFGGDGADNAIASSDPNNKWALSSQGLNIIRTVNGGTTFSARSNGINLTNVPFIARFEKCPNNDDVFIAGTDNVWRVNDFFSGSTAWTDNLGGVNFASGISGMAFAPSDATCGTYAFGTRSGSLRITSAGGGAFPGNWPDLDASNQVPNRAVTDLAFDPTNANVLYVTLSGFDGSVPGQPGHIFKTTNALSGAATWTNVSPPVDIPFNTIVVDPTNTNVLYAGSDLGIWRTPDAGATWAHMGPGIGMPNVAVFELQIASNGRLVAFTHGRSALALSNFDVDNDSVVNCADVAVVKAALGKRFGQVGYNAAADLNSDGIVDVRDLAMLTKQLAAGTVCP